MPRPLKPSRPSLLAEAIRRWRAGRVFDLGAALAYYALFSLAPLGAIWLAAAGALFGEEAARLELVRQSQAILGESGARPIERLVLGIRPFSTTALGTGASFAVLLWGAHLVFSQLKASLNVIWGARVRRHPVRHFLVARLAALAVVLLVVVLVVATHGVTLSLSTTARWAPHRLPAPSVLQGVDFLVSWALNLLLWGLVFKWLPDARTAWRDCWTGAFWTALLLVCGKLVLVAYLSRINLDSIYGAAMSVVVVLMSVFLNAQIVLFGAVLTSARNARRHAGSE